jgi:acetate kinase
VVGHRIVNGGREFTRPTRITGEVKAAIEKIAAFAPLHSRVELEGIALLEGKCGSPQQIAVFDTAFHSSLPEAILTEDNRCAIHDPDGDRIR